MAKCQNISIKQVIHLRFTKLPHSDLIQISLKRARHRRHEYVITCRTRKVPTRGRTLVQFPSREAASSSTASDHNVHPNPNPNRSRELWAMTVTDELDLDWVKPPWRISLSRISSFESWLTVQTHRHTHTHTHTHTTDWSHYPDRSIGKIKKYQLSLTNPRDALHHSKRAANKSGCSVW